MKEEDIFQKMHCVNFKLAFEGDFKYDIHLTSLVTLTCSQSSPYTIYALKYHNFG